jgi:hypothetical protein
MSTLVASPPEPRARKVDFIPDAFVIHLEDGRSLTVPLGFPASGTRPPSSGRTMNSSDPASASTGPRSTRTSRCLASSASPAERSCRSSFPLTSRTPRPLAGSPP